MQEATKLIELAPTDNGSIAGAVVALESLAPTTDPEISADASFGASKVRDYHNKFEGSVDRLLALPEADLSAARIGRGREGDVYRLDIEGGESVAVKVGGIDADHIRIFRRGDPIDDLAHLRGIDPENTRAVMELLPGEVAHDLTYEDRITVPEDTSRRLVHKVLEMDANGLEVDPNPGNFLYDRESATWRVLDYKIAGALGRSRAGQVLALSAMLTRYAPWDAPDPFLHVRPNTDPSPEMIQARAQRQREDVTILNRFLDVLERDFPDILAEAAVEQTAIRGRGGASMLYNTYALPEEELYDNFKDRLGRLGLVGTELDSPVVVESSPEDDSIID